MAKIRLIVIGAFAVLVLGATQAASASAAACASLAKAGCISQEGELQATLPVTGAKKAGTGSELEVAEIGKIECTAAATSATLEETETEGVLALPFHIVFTGCKLAGHANCEVLDPVKLTNGTVETLGIKGKIESIAANVGKVTFEPEVAAGEFAVVEVVNCTQAVTIKVKGTQECKVQKVETQEKAHELTCATTESKLKDGTKLAVFSLTELLTDANAGAPTYAAFLEEF